MKFVKLLKYVERSYGNQPSFLILMSDGKEYISNGCQFAENTEYERKMLCDAFNCDEELNELLLSEPCSPELASLETLKNGESMFLGCKKLLKFDTPLPALENGSMMFRDSKLNMFNSDMPKLVTGTRMFMGTNLEKFSNNVDSLTDGDRMFYTSSIREFTSKLPSLVVSEFMFSYSRISEFKIDMPNIKYPDNMFFKSPLVTIKSKMPITDEYMLFDLVYGAGNTKSLINQLKACQDD